MKKSIIVFIFLLVSSSTFFSKDLEIEVDGAIFNAFDNSVIWELYYSFPDNILKYISKDSLLVGELKFSITIKNNYKTIDSSEWIVENFVKLPISQEKKFLFGTKRFFLPYGQYTANLEVSDLNNSSKANSKFNIFAREFPPNKVSISDIQIANNIQSIDTSKIKWNKSLIKNGLAILPNPSMEVVGKEPFLNLYYEVYNTKKISESGFKMKYTILNSLKDEIYSYNKKYQSENDAIVNTISIPLDVFPSGVYYIKVESIYSENRILDSVFSIKKFFLINPEMPPEQISNFSENDLFARSEFAAFDGSQLTEELNKIKYVATNYENELLVKLETPEAKRRFLFSFWRKRSTDTTSTFNPAYEDFKNRVKFCNTYFSYGKSKQGWKTDRGRIILKYGMPTQRDIYPPNADHRAYETWFYQDIQGGIYFHFVDLIGFNNFSLMHSTAIGENYNDNWFDQYVPIMNMDANQKLLDRITN